MKKNFGKITMLLALFMAIAVAGSSQIVVKIRPSAPPPARGFHRPPPPSRGHVWVEGEWVVQGGRYVQRPGYWMAPRRGYRWQAGQWVARRGGWVWIPGRWVRGGGRY
jgi:hypothetical protein